MEDLQKQIQNIFKDSYHSDWELVKFGDVVHEVRESCKDPIIEGIEHIVGLEHLVPNDIHIRSWGNIADSTTFARRFDEGQVLFGRRRAYQRKAALATFKGLCSGDIIVMEAKEGLNQKLLPFLIHSDRFFEWAVSTSAGSLSPRTKFKDLAKFEFRLPPPPIQEKLAELLWATDSLSEKYLSLVTSLVMQYDVLVDKYFNSQFQQDWKAIPLRKVSEINTETLSSKTNKDFTFHYLDISSIVAPKKLGSMQKLNFGDSPSRARRVVHDSDIIISLVRPYQQSFVMISDATDIIASTGTAVVTADSEIIDPKFLFHQFFSKRFLRFCEDRMTGTNYPAITSNDVKEFKVFLPNDLDAQRKISNQLDVLETLIEETQLLIEKTHSMQSSTISTIIRI